MSFMQAQDAIDRSAAAEQINAIYLAIRSDLEWKRDQIYDEIRSYSPPIPACDVQFNYLLEARSSVAQELSRLNRLCKQSLLWRDQLPLLDEFIAASTCLDEATKQQMRISLDRARAALESNSGKLKKICSPE